MVGGAIISNPGQAGAASDNVDSSLSIQESVDDANQTNLSTANVTIRGNVSNDTLGTSVIGAGDVNGDGNADVLVGAPGNDTAGNDSGAAYLFYGPVEDGEYDASEADATFTGEAAGDNAGVSLAAGDLNGDNYTDIVVGAPGHSLDGEDASAGAAYVIYGSESLNGTMGLAESDAMVTGEAAGDSAGHSLAVANTTGEGSSSLVVGAPYNDDAGNNSGAVYVLAGDTLGMGVSLADADVKLTGETANAMAGYAVGAAEDVTGDGTGDILVGAPGNNSTQTANVVNVASGAAYVVEGADLADWSGATSLANATLTLTGEAAGDNAGWSVATAGDVNGDGYADILVGAPGDDSAGFDAGAAYVVLGGPDATGTQSLANATLTLTGEAEGDLAGWSVSSAGSGDITCDGLADIVVGAPGNDSVAGEDSGAAYLVHGAENLSGVTSLGDANQKLHGEAEGDMAGYAVADVNDTSGDDLEDVAVGAPFNDANGANAGAVYIVNSECPPEEPAPTTTAPTTEAPLTEEPVTTEEPTTPAPKTTKAPKTTAAPTTSPPTTKAPKTTEAPTTSPPTTKAPKTTKAPTTSPPTTKAPKTTEAPTTAPTTEAPTTKAPKTTKAPTTQPPTTQPPTTKAPTTQPPTTSPPTTSPPTTRAPTTSPPTTTPPGEVRIDYKGCSEVWIIFETAPSGPVTATIQIYNASSGMIEEVEVTIEPEDLETVPGQYGDDPLFKFNVHEYVGEPESGDSKILGVTSVDGYTIGGEGPVNTAECAQNVPSQTTEEPNGIATTEAAANPTTEAPANPTTQAPTADPFDASISFSSNCKEVTVEPTDDSTQYTVEWTLQGSGGDSTTATGEYNNMLTGNNRYAEVTVRLGGDVVEQATCGGSSSLGGSGIGSMLPALVALLSLAVPGLFVYGRKS